jgi:hypothetical protein
MLKTRSGKFTNTDDDENVPNITNVYTEKNFVHVNQTVEKTAVDLFSEPIQEGNCSDIYFNEPLDQFNLLFIKNSW